MIQIRLSEDNFEYDIHSLVKAFYPKEEVAFLQKDAVFYVGGELGETPLSFDIEYGQSEIIMYAYPTGADTIKREVSLEGFSDYEADRKKIKSELKKGLYELLSELTGQKLPWGTLTGIRPVKIPGLMLEDGMSDEEIAKAMKEEYLASDEKIALSIEIAKREQELLKDIDYKNGYSLYVGIPFCPTRCLYCSFTSFSLEAWGKYVDAYVEALCKEIRFTAELMKDKPLNSFYMGGGTPTTLSPEQSEKVLKTIRESFDFTHCREFTVEAGRPDSITREKLEVLKKYGVDRISVNPQTMNQKTLDLIGRRHTVEQTARAYKLARECGFDNINMDLITGLLGETKDDMEYTMKRIEELRPDSLTLHSLALKRASRLNEKKEEYEGYESLNTKEVSEMLDGYARRMGLAPYYLYRQKNMTGNLENVGYATLDKAGIYNILIMEDKQTILALGAGGTTKVVFPNGERIERIDNVKSVELYIERIDEMIERKRSFFEKNKGELLWH